ncbi:MAG: arginine N-succinyltransferase, partial [Congregibacter sp.]|nr:arginine N-succinyltransferase [Congregibacter sp.]
LGDVDDLARLAAIAGNGLTSLPEDHEALTRNVEAAVASFERSEADPNDYFLMVLEDTEKQQVVGTSAVFARTGSRQAFYAYRIMSVTHYSHSLDTEIRSSLLHLTNDYTDSSEVGTLFLDPAYRGNGHWLSRSRYLLMAQFPERLAPDVIAELRGWFDDKGVSPFWEAIGSKFFAMSYAEADRLCGIGSNQFITELMPKYPIYTNLLPAAAAEVMGKPHDATVRAMELLLAEGFQYDNMIDIFDGGPLVRARISEIKRVQQSAVGIAYQTNMDACKAESGKAPL